MQKAWLTVDTQNGQYRAKSGIIVSERCNDYPFGVRSLFVREWKCLDFRKMVS